MVKWVILIVGLDITVRRPIQRLDDFLMAQGAEDISIKVKRGAVVKGVLKLEEKLEVLKVRDSRRAMPRRLKHHYVAWRRRANQAHRAAALVLRRRKDRCLGVKSAARMLRTGQAYPLAILGLQPSRTSQGELPVSKCRVVGLGGEPSRRASARDSFNDGATPRRWHAGARVAEANSSAAGREGPAGPAQRAAREARSAM